MKNKKMTIKDFFELCDILIRTTDEEIAQKPHDYNRKNEVEACSYRLIKKMDRGIQKSVSKKPGQLLQLLRLLLQR